MGIEHFAGCTGGLILRYNMCYNVNMNHHKPTRLAVAKLTTVGNSVGISLPKEVLSMLRVSKGDSLFFTQTPEGVLLTPYNPELAEIMETAETVMREDRDVLKILAQ